MATADLTELEGVALGVIARAPGCTAYFVRREFQRSPSAEWSGSAGAIYPAIERLTRAGLIRARPLQRGVGLDLTAAGRRAFMAWLTDAARAAGPGIDPFRVRSGHLLSLPARARAAAIKALRAAIGAQIALTRDFLDGSEAPEREALGLVLELQLARLAWLERQA